VSTGPHLRVLKRGRSIIAPAEPSIEKLVTALAAAGGNAAAIPDDGLRQLYGFLTGESDWAAHASVVRLGDYSPQSLRTAFRLMPFMIPASDEAFQRLRSQGRLTAAVSVPSNSSYNKQYQLQQQQRGGSGDVTVNAKTNVIPNQTPRTPPPLVPPLKVADESTAAVVCHPELLPQGMLLHRP